MAISALDHKLRELILLYINGSLEEKKFVTAYRRLIRLQALFRCQ